MIQRRADLRFGGGGSSGQQRRGWNVKSSSVQQVVEHPTRDRDREFRARRLSSGELTNIHSSTREAMKVTSSMETVSCTDRVY